MDTTPLSGFGTFRGAGFFGYRKGDTGNRKDRSPRLRLSGIRYPLSAFDMPLRACPKPPLC
jgi:hypothetical protein